MWHYWNGTVWSTSLKQADVENLFAKNTLNFTTPVYSSELKKVFFAGDLPFIRATFKPLPAFNGATPSPGLAPSQASPAEAAWFAHTLKNKESGPWTGAELAWQLELGNLTPHDYIWRDGMTEWEPARNIPEVQAMLAQLKTKAPSGTPQKNPAEKREHPRRPILAKVIFTNQKKVYSGILRDLSLGGIQVLADAPEIDLETKLYVNVSSTHESRPSFNAFSATGVVARILSGEKGFSFRFSELPSAARKEIEKILQSEHE